MNSQPNLRAIPSVERLLQALGPLDVPRPVATAIVRRELTTLRAVAKTAPVPDFDAMLVRVRVALDRLRAARLQPIINGTGVLIHTNLGRAPLPDAALAAIATLGADYNNLEYDLAAGERARHRAGYVEHNLALLCGAEAATVVNNCAAALVLMLQALRAARGPQKKRSSSRAANSSRSAAVSASRKSSQPAALNCARSARRIKPRSMTTSGAITPANGAHPQASIAATFTWAASPESRRPVAELASLARQKTRSRWPRTSGAALWSAPKNTPLSNTSAPPPRRSADGVDAGVFQRGQTASAAHRRGSDRWAARGGSRF